MKPRSAADLYVIRPQINTGNLKRIMYASPRLDEQHAVIVKFESIQAKIRGLKTSVEKLQQQKPGLMQDLPTGRVPVPVDAPEQETA